MSEQSLGFESLEFYQHALNLMKAAYKLAESLPVYERYNLSDQLRRASVSVLLNIAEGYGRYHYLDRIRFFFIARGSLCETLSGFIAAHALGYLDSNQLVWIRAEEESAEKALNGYVGFIRKQKQGEIEFGSKYVREDLPEYHDAIDLTEDPSHQSPAPVQVTS